MKKLILLTLFLLFSNSIFSQSIEVLESKNGFKDFKLSDNYSKWENDLNFLRNFDDGSKLYKYNGNCCKKLFNYKVDKIDLQFKDAKLVMIYITTEKLQKDKGISGKSTEYYGTDAQSINSSFAFLFGEPTSKRVPENSSAVFYDWESENVILISKYDYLGIHSGDRMQITVGLTSYVYRKITNGF